MAPPESPKEKEGDAPSRRRIVRARRPPCPASSGTEDSQPHSPVEAEAPGVSYEEASVTAAAAVGHTAPTQSPGEKEDGSSHYADSEEESDDDSDSDDSSGALGGKAGDGDDVFDDSRETQPDGAAFVDRAAVNPHRRIVRARRPPAQAQGSAAANTDLSRAVGFLRQANREGTSSDGVRQAEMGVAWEWRDFRTSLEAALASNGIAPPHEPSASPSIHESDTKEKISDGIWALISEGQEHLNDKNWAGAIPIYKKVVRALSPEHCGSMWAALSMCYQKLCSYDDAKKAAQKSVDLGCITGYPLLAEAHRSLWEFDKQREVLEEGLRIAPLNPFLQGEMAQCKKHQESRKLYQEATLDVPEISCGYLGGPWGGFSLQRNSNNVPQNTAYGRLDRPPLPPLSRKRRDVSEYSDVIKPVLKSFFNGQLKVKWFCTENTLNVEGYMPNDPVPVVVYKAENSWGDDVPEWFDRMGIDTGSGRSGAMFGGSTFEQNPTYFRCLSSDEQETLCMVTLQRFLREKGSQLLDVVSEETLERLIDMLVKSCKEMGFYKDSVDLRLTHTDILINRGITGNILVNIARLGEELESAKQYSIAAGIYLELAEAGKVYGKKWGPEIPAFTFHNYAGLAFKRGGDLVNAEKEYVEALGTLGPEWDWLSGEGDGAGHKMVTVENLMVLYESVYHSVIHGLKTDDTHRRILSAGQLCMSLASVAGFEFQLGEMWGKAAKYQAVLKQRWQNKRKALRALIHATMASGINQYHERLFDCRDKRKHILDFATKQQSTAEYVRGVKAHNKAGARQQDVDDPRQVGSVSLMSKCDGCSAMKKKGELKECPCRTVHYCTKECQVTHWHLIHKKRCPTKKNAKKK